jgi:DnaJ-domain-containing protein 1
MGLIDISRKLRYRLVIKRNADEEAKRRAGKPATPARCPNCMEVLANPDDERCLFCGQEWNRDPKAEEPEATSRSASPLSPAQARLLLGLGRTFSADELKTAWKRKVSEWHPDKLDGMADELRTLATQRVQSLNEAYALLRR